MDQRRTGVYLLQAAAVVLSLSLLTACASTESSAPVKASTDGFIEMFAGYSADYDPVETPADLSALSDLVVSGRIVSVTDGRLWGRSESEPGANRSVILNIKVSTVHSESAPRNAQEMVFVELPSPGGVKAAAYKRALPRDLQGIFYLVPAASSSEGSPIQDDEAGRPSGQALYQPTNPQGIILSTGDGTSLLIEGEEFDGASLAEFLPDAERFPYDPASTPEPDVPPN